MKVDTNKLNSNIFSICQSCGTHALTLSENNGKKQFDLSTWHKAICDVCGKEKHVTETRDFMYPVVEVLNDR